MVPRGASSAELPPVGKARAPDVLPILPIMRYVYGAIVPMMVSWDSSDSVTSWTGVHFHTFTSLQKVDELTVYTQ